MALYESKRGLRHSSVSIAVLMLVAALILVNANCSRAAVLVKSNDTYNGCVTGREEECLIAEDLELELLEYYYSSHVSRVLAQKTTNPGASLNAGRATTAPCCDGVLKFGATLKIKTIACTKEGGKKKRSEDTVELTLRGTYCLLVAWLRHDREAEKLSYLLLQLSSQSRTTPIEKILRIQLLT